MCSCELRENERTLTGKPEDDFNSQVHGGLSNSLNLNWPCSQTECDKSLAGCRALPFLWIQPAPNCLSCFTSLAGTPNLFCLNCCQQTGYLICQPEPVCLEGGRGVDGFLVHHLPLGKKGSCLQKKKIGYNPTIFTNPWAQILNTVKPRLSRIPDKCPLFSGENLFISILSNSENIRKRPTDLDYKNQKLPM